MEIRITKKNRISGLARENRLPELNFSDCSLYDQGNGTGDLILILKSKSAFWKHGNIEWEEEGEFDYEAVVLLGNSELEAILDSMATEELLPELSAGTINDLSLLLKEAEEQKQADAEPASPWTAKESHGLAMLVHYNVTRARASEETNSATDEAVNPEFKSVEIIEAVFAADITEKFRKAELIKVIWQQLCNAEHKAELFRGIFYAGCHDVLSPEELEPLLIWYEHLRTQRNWA